MKKDKRLILIVAMIIAVIASISTIMYGVTFKKDMALSEQPTAMTFWSIAYWTAVALTVHSVLLGIVFLIKDAIGIKAKFLIVLAATIVAFVVAYLCAPSADIAQSVFEKTGTDYSLSKVIGAGLYTVYVLFAGVIVTVIYSEIAKRLK